MLTVKTIKNVVGKNSPTILTCLSIGGMIGTVIMAVKVTPKVMGIITDERYNRESDDECNEPMTKMDIFKLSWTYYIPTVTMGAATIACIVGANALNIKRNAALTSAYYLSETALKEYQTKIIETIGEKKAKLIKDEVAQDHVNRTKKDNNTIIITGNGDTLCLDITSGRYFKSSVDKLKRAENDINYALISDMDMTLNEIYGYMGLDPIAVGGQLGWDINKDGRFAINISTCMSEDDEPCITCAFEAKPRY